MRPILHATLVAGTALLVGACASSDPYCTFAPGAAELCLAVQGRSVASSNVFFGEGHDDQAHHALELSTLEAMARSGGAVLVGMEMFQRPFQAPLDDYVAGRIDEKEMLRRTEYFTRWNFNYTFYAPLWRLCRARGFRVVALNAESSITQKVGREGLTALAADERASIAAEIDLANPEHRERILGIFTDGAHLLPADRLEHMYEAMTVWDETMADTAATAVRAAGPGARMLVVAGRNHCEPTGIPDRFARRLPGAGRVLILAETDDEATATTVARDRDRFVVTFADREKPAAPKLGVMFDAKPSEEGLAVVSVVDGGAAAKAGIVAGDLMAELAGQPLRDTTDLRYVLDAKTVGDVVSVRVHRGSETLDLLVTLAPLPEAAPTK